MDKLDLYRKILQDLLSKHAKHLPSHGEIEPLPIADTENDNYLLIDLGWDKSGRVHAVAFHIRIKAGKVWLEWDGTETGLTEELIEAGIPQEDIVLGFYRPERRALTGFAVA